MLHYTTYLHSNTDKWVTFVHGAGGSSAIWHKQIRDFKKEYNVLLLDLRGHGQSKMHLTEKLKAYTFESIGDEIIDVLDHLNIVSSHFVGISLGTIVIRDLAERYPTRFDSLIMGGAVMKLNLRGQFLMRFGATFKSILPYILLYRLFAFIIMPRKNHRESRILFIDEAKKLYQKEFKRWFGLISQVNPMLALFRIKSSDVPTLYIMGEEDHMFLPSITKLVKSQSNCTLVVVPNCGHVVNIEKPLVFNHSVLGFLREQN